MLYKRKDGQAIVNFPGVLQNLKREGNRVLREFNRPQGAKKKRRDKDEENDNSDEDANMVTSELDEEEEEEEEGEEGEEREEE